MSRMRAGLLVERAAPLDADRLGHGDLHVIDVPRFQTGSNIPFANRKARMFWTVSLPR